MVFGPGDCNSGRGRRSSSRLAGKNTEQTPVNSVNSDETETITDTMNFTKTELENLLADKLAPLETKIASLEQTIKSKDEKIALFEARIAKLEEQNAKLTATNARIEAQLLQSTANNIALTSEVGTLRILIDDQEQRGRKMSLRMEGLEWKKGEKNPDLRTSVLDKLNEFGANLEDSDICRTHRTGKPKKDRDSDVTVAQTIIRFRSWGARMRAYQAKFFSKTNEKREQINCDLTRRRLHLLNRARDLLGAKHPVAHVYADAECRLLLKIRTTDTKIEFNTEFELQNAIARIPPPPVVSGLSEAAFGQALPFGAALSAITEVSETDID